MDWLLGLIGLHKIPYKIRDTLMTSQTSISRITRLYNDVCAKIDTDDFTGQGY